MEIVNYICTWPHLLLWSTLIGFGLALGFFLCKLLTSTFGALVLTYYKKLKK